ncbi:NlpC/P60 family protein [Yinghuangia sp. ASG 101]|uniref:C40 family peptidase n=1 Tax=Yinghuangia sp. ASG 101 TaxID=2896848 RepID=UPI001E416FEF|nr:NlpC/P60 family protein [Yinghuangia sp. ASG 101]UGQ15002.1 NlpC/P60 family protein [Yinghuangia sp. ASG 101]
MDVPVKRRPGCGCLLAAPFGVLTVGLVVIAAIAGGLSGSSGETKTQVATVGSFVSDAVPAEYRDWVSKAGQVCAEVPAQLLAAQFAQESGWDPDVVSPAGAQGIAQFMPETWVSWARDADGDGTTSPLDAPDAIMAGAAYDCALAAMVRGYVEKGQASGDIQDLMLAAYNAGPGAVLKYGGVPPYVETQNYVQIIRSSMAKFQKLTPVFGSAFGEAVVAAARQWLDTPYSWGGGTATGPSRGIQQGANINGFDCSGLVLYAVYQASAGAVTLPHLSQLQSTMGQPVDQSQMLPGDIIGLDPHRDGDYSHIGIYVGNNEVLHAPRTGDVVKISPLTDSYWANGTWAVRRFG